VPEVHCPRNHGKEGGRKEENNQKNVVEEKDKPKSFGGKVGGGEIEKESNSNKSREKETELNLFSDGILKENVRRLGKERERGGKKKKTNNYSRAAAKKYDLNIREKGKKQRWKEKMEKRRYEATEVGEGVWVINGESAFKETKHPPQRKGKKVGPAKLATQGRKKRKNQKLTATTRFRLGAVGKSDTECQKKKKAGWINSDHWVKKKVLEKRGFKESRGGDP